MNGFEIRVIAQEGNGRLSARGLAACRQQAADS
jgi:hypothetical protein